MRSETRKRIKRRKEDRKETLFLRIVRYADREKKNLKINTERRSRLAGWLADFDPNTEEESIGIISEEKKRWSKPRRHL